MPELLTFNYPHTWGEELKMERIHDLHSVGMNMLLEAMAKYSNGGPGQPQIMADMRRLTDSVNALAVLATDTNPEITREQREAATMKAADKLGAILPTVSERLETLKAATAEAFELAFAQNSGLVQTPRAAEIRAHLKGLTLAERIPFINQLLINNDNETLGAAILAPPYLSGFDAVSHARLKDQIETMRLPELAENKEKFAELYGNLKVGIATAQAAVTDFGDARKLADLQRQAVKVAEAQKRLDAATLPVVQL